VRLEGLFAAGADLTAFLFGVEDTSLLSTSFEVALRFSVGGASMPTDLSKAFASRFNLAIRSSMAFVVPPGGAS
jgi:hypothetical protein